MKDWTLIQVEGEPIITATPEEVNAAVIAKGGAKKPPAKDDKKKQTAALEEITDNRPRIVSYTKNFMEDGVAALKVNDDFANFFEKFMFKFQIFKVDRETQQESLKEEYCLDLSRFLFSTLPETATFKFDKLKTVEYHYLNIQISTDQPLLSSFLRRKLNPIMVELVACKDIPYKTEPRYKPIYSVFEFVDGRKFTTLEMPQ